MQDSEAFHQPVLEFHAELCIISLVAACLQYSHGLIFLAVALKCSAVAMPCCFPRHVTFPGVNVMFLFSLCVFPRSVHLSLHVSGISRSLSAALSLDDVCSHFDVQCIHVFMFMHVCAWGHMCLMGSYDTCLSGEESCHSLFLCLMSLR